MKKLTLVLVLLLAVTGVSLFAQDFDLGSFPAGKWVHPDDKTVWEFAATGIRILDTSGKVLFTFNNKEIKNFKAVLAGGTQPGFTFSYDTKDMQWARSYRFTINLSNSEVSRTIERDGLAADTVTMKKQ